MTTGHRTALGGAPLMARDEHRGDIEPHMSQSGVRLPGGATRLSAAQAPGPGLTAFVPRAVILAWLRLG